MRFSIQEQNEKKMFFHVPSAAQKATGVNLTTIKTILERGGNPIYHRKSDNKIFSIRKEEPIKILTIEGEDFFSLEEIQAKFDLSPTKFLNQVKNGKFAKKIDWISDELSSPEKEDEKIDELEILRAEMKFQFKKFREEIDELSSRVETLEKEKLELEKKLSERVYERSEPKKQSPPPKVSEVSPSIQKATLEEKDPPKQYPTREKPIFKAQKLLQRSHFFSAKAMARFIKDGIVGRIIIQTPMKQKYVLLDEKREYLPDLVKEIIVTHLHPDMGEEFRERIDTSKVNFGIGLKGKDAKEFNFSPLMIGRIRRLDPATIDDIIKELMKII